MPTTLITGCDYGIGFELARQYAGDGWRVHAVCLDAGSEAKLVRPGGELCFHHLDVTEQPALRALAKALAEEPIDVLISNAATFAPDGTGPLELPEPAEFVRVMHVTAVAPVYLEAAES